GELVNLAIARGSGSPFLLDRVPFSVIQGPKPGLSAGPMNITLGHASQIQARALVNLLSYQASIRGEGNVQRLLQLASYFGIATPTVAADGASSVDLAMAGNWGARPTVTGTAQLHNVRASIRGLNVPLEIRNASLTLGSDSVRVQNINAESDGMHLGGSMLI